MSPREFLERLDGARQTRDTQYVARCPAHDDRHASLSVAVADDGRVLLHCHAGCDVHQILAALNLAPTDLFDDLRARARVEFCGQRIRIPAHSPVGRFLTPPNTAVDPLPSPQDLDAWTACLPDVGPWLHRTKGWDALTLQGLGCGWDGRRLTIPVHDRHGNLTTVVRYRPGGKPKTLALQGHDRDLFPAPELFDDDVWLVEGEPDAITAAHLGLPAVAIPGVAKWRDDWTGRFAGRRVTVLMDCDREGRAAARRVELLLLAAGVDCRIVDLDGGRQDGHDLGDVWRAAVVGGFTGDTIDWLHTLQLEAWT